MPALPSPASLPAGAAAPFVPGRLLPSGVLPCGRAVVTVWCERRFRVENQCCVCVLNANVKYTHAHTRRARSRLALARAFARRTRARPSASKERLTTSTTPYQNGVSETPSRESGVSARESGDTPLTAHTAMGGQHTLCL